MGKVARKTKNVQNKKTTARKTKNNKKKYEKPPTKGRSAWIYFCKQNWIKDVPFGEVCRTLSTKWKELEDRSPYLKLQTEDKLRYETEMTNITPEQKAELKRRRQVRRQARKNVPRHFSPYIHFVNAVYADVVKQNPGTAFTEVGKLLGKQWKELSAEERAIYQKQSDAQKQQIIAAQKQEEEVSEEQH